MRRGLVRITTVTRLEIGFSARSGTDLRATARRPPLSAMPVEYLTPAMEDRAAEVQGLLADRGHHRAPSVPDLLIAAVAPRGSYPLQGRSRDRGTPDAAGGRRWRCHRPGRRNRERRNGSVPRSPRCRLGAQREARQEGSRVCALNACRQVLRKRAMPRIDPRPRAASRQSAARSVSAAYASVWVSPSRRIRRATYGPCSARVMAPRGAFQKTCASLPGTRGDTVHRPWRA